KGSNEEAAASLPESEPGIIDHGELDLLSDDEPLDVGETDLSAPGGEGIEPLPSGESNASSNNGSSLGEDSESVGRGGESSDDEISSIDLLSEDDGIPSGGFSRGEASLGKPADEEETRRLPREAEAESIEMAPVHAERDPEKGTEKSTEKGGKKAGKPKLGKGLKKLGKKAGKSKGDKEPAEEKEEGAEAVEAEASGPAAAPRAKAPARSRAAGALTFICSECYEEFLLPPTFSQEMVSCPECL